MKKTMLPMTTTIYRIMAEESNAKTIKYATESWVGGGLIVKGIICAPRAM
jgi:hypothetical protein